MLVTFYAYLIIDGNRLTPRSAFVTLFLFDIIRYSLFKFPNFIVESVKALVSLRRVLRFLHEEEREPSCIVPRSENDEYAGKQHKDFKAKTHFKIAFQLNLRMYTYRGLPIRQTSNLKASICKLDLANSSLFVVKLEPAKVRF